MARNRRDIFTTIKSEGALLPPDFLQKMAEGGPAIDGLTPEAYHLAGGEKLNEAASRAWNRLLGPWQAFQAASKDLRDSDPGTSITREKWLLPLFQELGYGRLLVAKTLQIDGKPYPISYLWQHTPIHFVGRNVDLDRRSPGVAGAAKTSPHGLLLEFLNRADGHLWGFVSNGLALRILRDNKSFTRQAYVEFDLVGMMEGQVYADFVFLWLLCHESRVESERPEQCWLERWSQAAREQGTRALDQLRVGVKSAIEALGKGFLSHPANRPLIQRLREGNLTKQDYYRQLLRQVYRLIFLFVAEDRDLLLTALRGSPERLRYSHYYSVARLRTLAERRRGSPHTDLWHGLRVVFGKLSSETGCPDLGLPALGSFLWSSQATPDLDGCDVANGDFLDAIRSLAFTADGRTRRVIDYKNLGPEELGSVYESLLELHPEVNADASTFSLTTAAGHERKTTGSYYTPTSLIDCLLDSALEPVLAEAANQPEPEKAILNLKVCDPACGSGHFLIAAAHRIANRLATARTGDEEPSPEAVRKGLRDVIGHCLYGVDINPMAVELCKVNLWLEALEPGKPLSFLEHRIQCGNSLLGTTPALLKNGIPNEAFEPLEGDDKTYCREYKKKNKKEREGQRTLFQPTQEPWDRLGELITAVATLDAITDDTLDGQRAKQQRWEELVRSNSYEFGRLWADAWCAAFVWKKVDDPSLPYPITEEVFRRIEKNPLSLAEWMRKEIRRLAEEYRLLHWHLAFPDILRVSSTTEATGDSTGWVGGFDVVLGNPPWDRIKLQEEEFFAERSPSIANAPNASARGRLIKRLEVEDAELFLAFRAALRRADGETVLVRRTGRYPLCGRGDINTYSIFAELNWSLLGSGGRAGFVVPTGIATDDTTKFFFERLTQTGALVSLYSFFETRRIFLDTDSRAPFCLLTLRGNARPPTQAAEFAFDLRSVSDIRVGGRCFSLTAEDIALVNPNTRTCPIFKTQRDAEITKAIYRRVPVLINETPLAGDNPWGLDFLRMFDMANDSGLFRTRDQLEGEGWTLKGNVFDRDSDRCVPLYEAKMIHHFNHRYGDYADKPANSESTSLPDVPEARLTDPDYRPLPRYWVREEEVFLRASRVPPALIEAHKAKNQDKATQAIAYWLAGYHLNHGDAAAGKGLVERLFSRGILTAPAQSIVVEIWLAEGLAPRLEREYPLGADGVAIIEASEDALSAAATLIETRCPRWFLGWRDICRSTDERTVIADVIPRVGVNHKFPLALSTETSSNATAFLANLNSFVLDYVTRQKLGGTSLTYFTMKQLPLLPPTTYAQPAPWTAAGTLGEWVKPRILELVYTASDLQPFARDVAYAGAPFVWDSDRRFQLRCELDAAFFHLYDLGREDTAYIIDTFPIVRRHDEERFGAYRTKQAILEAYSRLGETARQLPGRNPHEVAAP